MQFLSLSLSLLNLIVMYFVYSSNPLKLFNSQIACQNFTTGNARFEFPLLFGFVM